jgi:hypothetical protein
VSLWGLGSEKGMKASIGYFYKAYKLERYMIVSVAQPHKLTEMKKS